MFGFMIQLKVKMRWCTNISINFAYVIIFTSTHFLEKCNDLQAFLIPVLIRGYMNYCL